MNTFFKTLYVKNLQNRSKLFTLTLGHVIMNVWIYFQTNDIKNLGYKNEIWRGSHGFSH